MKRIEMNESKIVAIGDVHGSDRWKHIVEQHPDDRIVFLGDYLDPYQYVPEEELVRNLQLIISLKKEKSDSVVLLLGNHDLHYFCEDMAWGTRFNIRMMDVFFHLFMENIHLFQNAYQVDKIIFTHAGISHEWFVDDFKGNLDMPIAEQLNHPDQSQLEALYRVGGERGGSSLLPGGIFWADKRELSSPLYGYRQVVGHNRVEKIFHYKGDHDNEIIFCDCLWKGGYLVI